MTDQEELLVAWASAEARLAPGWQLEALRCASTGLDPASRSDDWIAVATGPGGARLEQRSASAIGALAELVANLESVRDERSRR